MIRAAPGGIAPRTAHSAGNALRIDGSVPPLRLAYKIGEGEWADVGTLADRVLIRFDLHVPRNCYPDQGRGF